jgi:hypothetical protein
MFQYRHKRQQSRSWLSVRVLRHSSGISLYIPTPHNWSQGLANQLTKHQGFSFTLQFHKTCSEYECLASKMKSRFVQSQGQFKLFGFCFGGAYYLHPQGRRVSKAPNKQQIVDLYLLLPSQLLLAWFRLRTWRWQQFVLPQKAVSFYQITRRHIPEGKSFLQIMLVSKLT